MTWILEAIVINKADVCTDQCFELQVIDQVEINISVTNTTVATCSSYVVIQHKTYVRDTVCNSYSVSTTAKSSWVSVVNVITGWVVRVVGSYVWQHSNNRKCVT